MARNPPTARRHTVPDRRIDPDRVDDVLAALIDRRRRRVLTYLRDNDGVGFVDELSDHLSEESATGSSEIRVELEHIALPTLVELGLVEHERETGLVVYAGDEFGTELLEWIADRERADR